MSGGGDNEDFAARRARARAATGAIQAASEARGEPLGWFEEIYDRASGDTAMVPWADEEPHPGLAEWIARSGFIHEGTCLDVGCGLGDNAEALAAAGYDVTAFDVSATAVEWARKRFPESRVKYLQASLLDPPVKWLQAFDFVHETYTLQSLKPPQREQAMHVLPTLLAPGGRLLVICRSREDGAPADGPPWPLSRAELGRFEDCGLQPMSFQSFTVHDTRGIVPHFRALYARTS